MGNIAFKNLSQGVPPDSDGHEPIKGASSFMKAANLRHSGRIYAAKRYGDVCYVLKYELYYICFSGQYVLCVFHRRLLISLINLISISMKKSVRIVSLAVALFAGVSGTALANGTYVPPPAPAAVAPQPPVIVETNDSTGPYIGAFVGAGLPTDLDFSDSKQELDGGVPFGGVIGYNFDPVRVDVSVGYQQHGYASDDNDDLGVLAVLGNLSYDFGELLGARPYLTAGAGFADLDTDTGAANRVDDTVFAWQVGAGLGVNLTDEIVFDLGYRYLAPSGLEDQDGNDVDWSASNILAGLRYQF